MLFNQLHEFAQLVKEASTLKGDIRELKLKVKSITDSLTSTKECPWLVLREAAKEIGISAPALRQRIKRHQYPENIVWRQKEATGKIFINMAAIGEYL